MTDNAPGWQSDPTGRHEHRYWDGTAWTDNVSDAGVASTDVYAAADIPAADVVSEPEAPAPPAAADAAPGWADPTTIAAPVASADPTSTWPTSPAPPAPPSYTPPAPAMGGPVGPDGSGGSKKGLFIGIGVLAAVAIVVAVLLMGGGDDKGDDNIRTQLAAQFKANSDLSGSQADCVADHVVDEMGADSFKDVDFTADKPPEAIAEDLFAAAASSLDACNIDPADFAGTNGSTDGGDGSTDSTLPDDFEKQLADIYESSLGLSTEQAECLAGKLADAVSSGDLSEEQAFSDVFDFLADCDIDPSEISGN